MSLLSFFSRAKTKAPPPAAPVKTDAPAQQRPHEANYPPVDGGLPLALVQDLLLAQSELIARIKTHAAVADSIFESRYMQPIKNLAEYILNLPATQDDAYAGPGGLFRASLELGFGAFQAAGGRIFTSHLGVEERQKLENRWGYVCFAAGLIWPLGKTLDGMRASGKTKTWTSRVYGLGVWAAEHEIQTVYLTWPKEHIEPGPSVNGAMLAGQIVGPGPIKWLEEGNPKVMTSMLEVASGFRTEYNGTAYDITKTMWEKCLARERARMPSNYGRVKFGQHMAPHLIDAMHVLIRDGKWVVNEKTIHADKTGVYLLWPQAGDELLAYMQKESLGQALHTPEGLLNLLMQEELLKVDSIGGVYVDVASHEGKVVQAVKILKPNMLIQDYSPDSFSKSRSVTMEQIIKEDPIAAAEKKAPKATGKKAETAAPTVKSELGNATSVDEKKPIAPPPAPDPLMATLGTEAANQPAPPKEQRASTLEAPVAEADALKSPAETPTPTPTPAPNNNVVAIPMPSRPAVGDTDGISLLALPSKRGDKAVPEVVTPPAEPVSTKPKFGDEVLAQRQNTGGTPVMYKDALPKRVISSISNGLVAEQLARLVLKIKEEGNLEKLIFKDEFVAVPWELFTGTVANPPNFLSALGDAGYLYFDAAHSGKKVHDLPASDGSKTKIRCFLMAKNLAVALELMKK